jgi:hypothetical protein
MNMLRDEDNSKYRSVIKNTLEFDPQILKRYVNFMNNPDERTAVDQFGKGDKYFGICTMMATMPGLPMFGHGQIEGYTEKYGMEYRRAYWDEWPDRYLVERHEREIFPLLRRRALFAEVDDFLLYDLFTPEGYVNEDVFAYSNRAGGERALVVYHNKYAETQGWIRTSVASAVKTGEGSQELVQKPLGDGLALQNDGGTYVIFRDQVTGLEYIRNNRELWENGLYVELGAYKYHVFVDFREVRDDEWRQYGQLMRYLDGRGVPDIEEALREVFLQPVHHPFRELVNADMFRRLVDARVTKPGGQPDPDLLDEVEQKTAHLLTEVIRITEYSSQPAEVPDQSYTAVAQQIRRKLEVILSLETRPLPSPLRQDIVSGLDDNPAAWPTLLGWLFTHALGRVADETHFAQVSRTWIDEWLLGKIAAGALRDLLSDEDAAWWAVTTIKILTSHQRWFDGDGDGQADRACRVLESWLQDDEVRHLLQVNRYQGVLWFNKEAFEQLLWWMMVLAIVTIGADPLLSASEVDEGITACYDLVTRLERAKDESGYQIEGLLGAARG